MLTGVLADQAALYGVLAEAEALGLELIEVRRRLPRCRGSACCGCGAKMAADLPGRRREEILADLAGLAQVVAALGGPGGTGHAAGAL